MQATTAVALTVTGVLIVTSALLRRFQWRRQPELTSPDVCYAGEIQTATPDRSERSVRRQTSSMFAIIAAAMFVVGGSYFLRLLVQSAQVTTDSTPVGEEKVSWFSDRLTTVATVLDGLWVQLPATELSIHLGIVIAMIAFPVLAIANRTKWYGFVSALAASASLFGVNLLLIRMSEFYGPVI